MVTVRRESDTVELRFVIDEAVGSGVLKAMTSGLAQEVAYRDASEFCRSARERQLIYFDKSFKLSINFGDRTYSAERSETGGNICKLENRYIKISIKYRSDQADSAS